MPQRFLKPGLTDSVRYNACSWPAQSLFTRLITTADDFGRAEADPFALSRRLFPFGQPNQRMVAEKDVAKWLAELAERDLVLLYEAFGRPLLVIKRWKEEPRNENTKPKCPPPPANICQQMLAAGSASPLMFRDVDLGKTFPASPSPSPSPSPSSSPSSSGNNNGAALEESKNQWAALNRRIELKEAEAKRGELTGEERARLQKMRDLRDAIEKKQVARDYSPVDLKELGLE